MHDSQQINNICGAILLVDDDLGFMESVRRMLISNGCANVKMVNDSRMAMSTLEDGGIAVVLLDWIMPHLTGGELLSQIVNRFPNLPVIIMTAVTDTETIVKCIHQGAFDYITKPIDEARLLSCIAKAIQVSEYEERIKLLTAYLQGAPLVRPDVFRDIVTSSPKMSNVLKTIESVAPTRTPILITGETGVGKELIARAIHRASNLTGNFVPVNVAGLDDIMFSDTLFGHVKGAFTGATEAREGLVAQAEGGTLFFDELGDLGPESQVKLLRLLQEQEYYRIGADSVRRCKARIIAASNRDFDRMRTNGTFRQDLYYRIGGFRLHIPALRERTEDIPLLLGHFLEKEAHELGREVPTVSDKLSQALQEHHFTGNVRELINMVRQALITTTGKTLYLADFPDVDAEPEIVENIHNSLRITGDNQVQLEASFETFPTLEQVETLLINEAMQQANGSKILAARMLGISRTTLNKRLNEEPDS